MGLCLFSWLFTTVEGRIQGVVQNLCRNPQDRSLRHQWRGLRAGRVFSHDTYCIFLTPSTARRHSPQQRHEKRRRIGRRNRSDRGINRVKKRVRGCKRECSQKVDRFLKHNEQTYNRREWWCCSELTTAMFLLMPSWWWISGANEPSKNAGNARIK